jgi:hypothetical protein
VDGSLASGSAVTVNNGGALGGSGTINGAATIASGGTLAPGSTNGTATLTFAGGLTLNGNANLDMDVGSSADLVSVTGGTLTGPVSGTVNLNVSDSGDLGAGIYPLIDWSGAAGSVTTNDFTLSLPVGQFGDLSVSGNVLSLSVDGIKSTIFKFR